MVTRVVGGSSPWFVPWRLPRSAALAALRCPAALHCFFCFSVPRDPSAGSKWTAMERTFGWRHYSVLQKRGQGRETLVLMVSTCDSSTQFWVCRRRCLQRCPSGPNSCRCLIACTLPRLCLPACLSAPPWPPALLPPPCAAAAQHAESEGPGPLGQRVAAEGRNARPGGRTPGRQRGRRCLQGLRRLRPPAMPAVQPGGAGGGALKQRAEAPIPNLYDAPTRHVLPL